MSPKCALCCAALDSNYPPEHLGRKFTTLHDRIDPHQSDTDVKDDAYDAQKHFISNVSK
tara:strand:- start:1493 stop:1669 length:177 start_codon:yes stop_codon:yes gene_type:complete